MLIPGVGERAERPQTGQQDVGPSFDGGEPGQAVQRLLDRLVLDGHVVGVVVVARDRILVMNPSLELRRVDPLLLHELELALEVGAAEEDRKPPIHAIIWTLFWQQRAVGQPAATADACW